MKHSTKLFIDAGAAITETSERCFTDMFCAVKMLFSQRRGLRTSEPRTVVVVVGFVSFTTTILESLNMLEKLISHEDCFIVWFLAVISFINSKL